MAQIQEIHPRVKNQLVSQLDLRNAIGRAMHPGLKATVMQRRLCWG